ncbi:MAG: adenylate kinase [Phycisphaerales bacterium]|nr:adenylate kinase [Phycisphaerales bacterium]
MRLALLGPPGAGKGTQARRICQTFNLVHLSSGDILRTEKMAGTAHGRRIRDFIDRGMLVPDSLMLGIMQNRICALQQGFVLDGFPRTLPQAKELSRLLKHIKRPLDLVINLDVPMDVLSRRFEGRRVCPICRDVYHIDSNPPVKPGICNNEGSRLIIREDDMPEVVRTRLSTYKKLTAPLIEFYATTEADRLVTINSAGQPDEVTKLVFAAIEKRRASQISHNGKPETAA